MGGRERLFMIFDYSKKERVAAYGPGVTIRGSIEILYSERLGHQKLQERRCEKEEKSQNQDRCPTDKQNG